MFRMASILLVAVTLAAVAGVPLVSAQGGEPLLSDDPPYPCPYSDGAFYQPNVFPRYDVNQGALVLVDAATNATVRVLEPLSENVRIINWSPDCRYLTGAVGEIRTTFPNREWLAGEDYVRWNRRDIVLWDAVNGGRVYNFENNPGEFLSLQPSVIWSPGGERALILGGCREVYRSCAHERSRYDLLWLRDTNTSVRIGQLPAGQLSSGGWLVYSPSRAWFNQYYWDASRNWLWGSAAGGIAAYDTNSGAEVAFLENYSPDGERCSFESRFFFSEDRTKVVVYSVFLYPEEGAVTVYDITTREATPINVEGFAAPYIPFAENHPVALSADNRYLVVGYTALRVWDLHHLPERVEERLPIYRHAGPQARIQSVRFADWGVIETTSAEGVQRWDLHTGEYLP